MEWWRSMAGSTGSEVGAMTMGGFAGFPNRKTKPTPAAAAISSQRVTQATRRDDPIQESLYRAGDYREKLNDASVVMFGPSRRRIYRSGRHTPVLCGMIGQTTMSSTASDYAIDLQNVTKIYRRRIHALQGVSMQVNRGEIFGLLGPNGAGKSTLVKIMMTVVRPTSAGG